MEIITGVERRRRWSPAEKLRIVAETEQAGSGIAEIARRYEISRGLLWNWRSQVRRGVLKARPLRRTIVAWPTSSRPHDNDCLCLPSTPSPRNREAGEKESMDRHHSQAYPPCVVLSSLTSLARGLRAVRTAANGSARHSPVKISAKVVLVHNSIEQGQKGKTIAVVL